MWKNVALRIGHMSYCGSSFIFSVATVGNESCTRRFLVWGFFLTDDLFFLFSTYSVGSSRIQTTHRPSIERSPDATTPISRSPKMGGSKSTPEMARRSSLDPYSHDGTQFRSETMGNQLSNYTDGVHNGNLTHGMKRDAKKQRTQKTAARKALESKRKLGWNAAPHVVLNSDPKLNDPSPFKAVTYQQYFKQKRKKETKKMQVAYTSTPFVIAKPVLKVPAIRGRRSPQKSRKGAQGPPPMETMGEENENVSGETDGDESTL